MHHIAREQKAAQKVAQILLTPALGGNVRVLLGQPNHVLQGVFVRAQHIQFLLCKVADAQPFALRDAPSQQGQIARNGFDQRGFALPVGAQHANALPGLYRATHIAQDDHIRRSNGRQRLARLQLVRVHAGAGAEILQRWGRVRRNGLGLRLTLRRNRGAVTKAGILDGQHRIGQLGRFLKFKGEIGTGEHGRELFHALQRLDAALRLFGLGGLGFEAVDEFLQMRDFFLLARISRLLQQYLLGALLFKRAVIAPVANKLGLLDVDGDLGDGVEKFPIVADDEQSARIAFEPALQPHQRIQIQVVGGLVQQQQIARAHQGARQLQAHAPATRKAADRSIQFMRLKTQPQYQRLCTRHGIVRARIVQQGVGMGHGHAVAAGLCRAQLGLRMLQSGVARQHKVGSAFAGFWHVLLYLRQSPGGGQCHIAAIFVQCAIEQTKQAGFARAVAPHQRHFFAGVDGDRCTIQQHLGAALQRDVVKDDHAAGSAAWCSKASRVSSSTWSPPALVSNQIGLSCVKAASK